MKNHLYKAALAAALGLAGASAAHAQVANNDLVLGFTSPNAASVGGTQYDYIIDLGQLLGASAQQITLSSSQYNASTFTTDLGSAVSTGSAYAGIFGGTTGTTADLITSAASTPATLTSTTLKSAADYPSSVTLGAVAQGGESVYDNISTAPGKAGAAANSFGEFEPSVLQTVTAAEGTGSSVLDLTVYESTITLSGLKATVNPFTDVGYVSVLFGSNGAIDAVAWDEAASPLTTTAVPEPATYGIFGGIGVLLLGLRRQLTGKLV